MNPPDIRPFAQEMLRLPMLQVPVNDAIVTEEASFSFSNDEPIWEVHTASGRLIARGPLWSSAFGAGLAAGWSKTAKENRT